MGKEKIKRDNMMKMISIEKGETMKRNKNK